MSVAARRAEAARAGAKRPRRTLIASLWRPARGHLTATTLLMLSMPLLVPSVLCAAGEAASQTPAVGPPPHIPAALFAMGPTPSCNEQLCFSAHSDQPGVASLTASRNRIVLINPDILDKERGSRLTADHAVEVGADFGNSQTALTGDVHADMAQGQFSAADAMIRIVDSQVASIVAHGSPALFLRRGTAPGTPATTQGGGREGALANGTVYGHADSITYDLKADSVQLEGNGWLTDGCNEFTSQRITYNLTSQTVEAGPAPGAKSRVQGTIRSTHAGTSCATASGS